VTAINKSYALTFFFLLVFAQSELFADPVTDCSLSADGTACLSADGCFEGTCISSACNATNPTTALPCIDANPCTANLCSHGVCTHPALANGSDCSNPDLCIEGTCTQGQCQIEVTLECTPTANHYLKWQANAALSHRFEVTLTDRVLQEKSVRLSDLLGFLNPTQKIRNEEITPIVDTTLHYMVYSTCRGNRTPINRLTLAQDQFGSQTLLALSPTLLLSPAVNLANPSDDIREAPHYRCYEVKTAFDSHFPPNTFVGGQIVTLVDEFNQPGPYQIIRAEHVCIPVIKDRIIDGVHVISDADIFDSNDSLVCYEAKALFKQRTVTHLHYNDQFQTTKNMTAVRKNNWLCTPARVEISASKTGP
jgi:hypothetical protein